MELIIGGAYQGKLDYLLSLTGYSKDKVLDVSNIELPIDANLLLKELADRPILYQFHLLIKRLLEQDLDPYPLLDQLIHQQSEGKELFIICNEIGNGIVPMLPSDRYYRETLGRILCELAKESKRVHRVILGIGTIIKED
ncbi:bifunctional adenosylcobinamide kinase/adenosylcobinamide-phosphate guanylyltransferase [Anaeromicropila herbilytica]|uniref:Adenosylcobinamide kinase n=1 Tax=Anaeromicropila herbilytica TaxID=2785025 RepID=A0A7R7IGC1_9FIRM|nr:bifunctional adenosylcobinamide kinase/adenosylcobinamide-phosphate guanylyltransferase [Anaeromicropila herbilytica]BCN32963.1 hypothetical protein bsdtb5_42580 [Anaeromicropila herbilytica]